MCPSLRVDPMHRSLVRRLVTKQGSCTHFKAVMVRLVSAGMSDCLKQDSGRTRNGVNQCHMLAKGIVYEADQRDGLSYKSWPWVFDELKWTTLSKSHALMSRHNVA